MVGRTLFWVHAVSGKVTEERHGDGILEGLEDLNAYNCERVDEEAINQVVDDRLGWLATKILMAGLPSDLLEPLDTLLITGSLAVVGEARRLLVPNDGDASDKMEI